MKRIAVGLLALLMFTCCGVALAEEATPIVGHWKTIDDATGEPKSIVQIFEAEGRIHGKIVELINPDEENPLCDQCDGELYNQPILGMTILKNIKAEGDKWGGGKILDPENGKTYKVHLKVEEDGRLKVRGFIGFSLLGRTQHWLPAQDPASNASSLDAQIGSGNE